jgi:hypothetical protein
VTIERPSSDDDVSSSMPAAVLIASSSGFEICVSTSSGLAPRWVVTTVTTGRSTSGNWSTPSFPNESTPNATHAPTSIVANTGRLTQISESVIRSHLADRQPEAHVLRRPARRR